MARHYDDAGPNEPVIDDPREGIIEEIIETFGSGQAQANSRTFDVTNTENDFIAISMAYLGRAARRVPRNDREGHGFRENVLKAIGVLIDGIAAIDARADAQEGF